MSSERFFLLKTDEATAAGLYAEDPLYPEGRYVLFDSYSCTPRYVGEDPGRWDSCESWLGPGEFFGWVLKELNALAAANSYSSISRDAPPEKS